MQQQQLLVKVGSSFSENRSSIKRATKQQWHDFMDVIEEKDISMV